MKPSQKSVPSANTGAVRGDYNRSQSIQWKNKGGHNLTTDEARHGSGLAPKPSGGAAILGNDRPSMPTTAGMARVKNAPMGPSAGSFMPVNKPMAGLQNQRVGQKEMAAPGSSVQVRPITKTSVTDNAIATKKPRRSGLGAAFLGEY